MNVREVTATTAGNQNLFAGAFRPFEHGDSPPALAGLRCAEEASSTGSENYGVKSS